MTDYQLHKGNLSQVFDALQVELETKPVLWLSVQDASTGKWSMAKLWRAMMSTTAKWMAANGATMPLVIPSTGEPYGKRAFSAEDAHCLFCHQHGGADKDGTRLSWSRKPHDGMRTATVGERCHMIEQHLVWSTERGITHMLPRDSEYSRLKKEGEK